MAYLSYGERILSGLFCFHLTVQLGWLKYRFMSEVCTPETVKSDLHVLAVDGIHKKI